MRYRFRLYGLGLTSLTSELFDDKEAMEASLNSVVSVLRVPVGVGVFEVSAEDFETVLDSFTLGG